MFQPRTSYAKIAYDAILFYVSTGQIRKVTEDKISADLKLKVGCIVSIFDINDNLIGYYGGVESKNKALYDEIIENAVGAASKDKDHEPIKSEQLNQIKVYVDVLSVAHKVEDINELKPQKHGLIAKDKAGNTGFIIPGRKGVKTIEKQIETLNKETDISETDISKLELLYFKSTRYD